MRCFDNALTTLPTNESLNNYKAAAAAAFFCLFNFALLCNADGGPFPLPLPLLFLPVPPLRPTWGRKCVKCNIIIYALTRFISLAYLPCTLCNWQVCCILFGSSWVDWDRYENEGMEMGGLPANNCNWRCRTKLNKVVCSAEEREGEVELCNCCQRALWLGLRLRQSKVSLFMALIS